MSSTFLLELDTHAPEVEFGEASGTTAGEFLRIQYVSDEPIERARLRLADGRYLTMGVAADELAVLLPPDTVQGPAGVEVRDEVWNLRLYAGVVLLQGVPLPPVDQPVPIPGSGRGPRPAAPATVRVVGATRVGVESTGRLGALTRLGYSEIRVASLGPILVGELRLGESVEVGGMCASRVAQHGRSAVSAGSSSVRRRRDDEDLVALILGLQS